MLSQYAYYIAIVRLPHILGQSAKIYAGVGEGTPDGVLRLRIGSRHVEVPLPGGGPRSRLQGPGDLLSHRRCTAGDYGRIVRNFLQTANRHVFTPVPHDSPSWHRGYNQRDAPERINPRQDNSFGLKRHYSRGKASMTTRVGLALGHVLEGCPGRMRSLVAPVPFRGAG